MNRFSVVLMVRLVIGCVLMPCSPACADTLIESYVARLSASDHFNSNGERLTSPAMIIRQDRANFYKFGRRDPEDENDSFFRDLHSREILQKLLERGTTSKEVYRSIVNGQPLVRVNVYQAKGGDYANVSILED
jgi:hypothetical protein